MNWHLNIFKPKPSVRVKTRYKWLLMCQKQRWYLSLVNYFMYYNSTMVLRLIVFALLPHFTNGRETWKRLTNTNVNCRLRKLSTKIFVNITPNKTADPTPIANHLPHTNRCVRLFSHFLFPSGAWTHLSFIEMKFVW